MAWLFQGVLNAGLQILLSIWGGWLCARLRLVDPEVLSRQLNAFAMRAAFPAFIIHLLGIKTNLQDLQAWRALGVFVLWVFLIHLACILWHKLRGSHSTVQHLGINCLLLTTNNTGCIGWPVLIATVGRQGAALSMLLGVLFFVQLLPAAISCFEYHKSLQEHQEEHVEAIVLPGKSAAEAGADGKLLPTTSDPAEKQATGFPHEFRYCYWSNADYTPTVTATTSSRQLVPVAAATADKAYPNYVEVCVDQNFDDKQDRQHSHRGSPTASSSNAASSSAAGTAAATAAMAAKGRAKTSRTSSSSTVNAGKEWWRQGSGKKPEPLKRAKDSCDSLHSPFAAAAISTKADDMAQKPQVVQSPRPVAQLSSLTRRLSRGLSQHTAAAAAAASSAAGAVAAAAAAPASLVRAASLKRQQLQQQRGASLAGMSVPLLLSHEGPASCGGATSPALAACSVPIGSLAAARRISDNTISGAAGSAVELSSPPESGQQQLLQQQGSAAAAGLQQAGRQRSAGMGDFSKAADSAVELHAMCQEGNSRKQQQVDKQGPNFKLNTELAPTSAAAASSGSLQAHNSSFVSRGSFLSSLRLGIIIRANSRTALLGPAALAAAALNGKRGPAAKPTRTKPSVVAHGAATAAGAAGASCAGGLASHEQEVSHRTCFGSFVKSHPLLCHIAAVQFRSFHLWLNVLAIALSVSGARKYLDADSALFIPALGWFDGVLGWFSSACIPVLLFANGVWMVGKDVFGGRKGQLQVTLLLLLKLALLPAFMVGLTQLFGMRDAYGLSLVLLCSCPLAPLAFLVCQQYGVGAELATSVAIQGVLLMLPQMMAVIKISQVAGLYDVPMFDAV